MESQTLKAIGRFAEIIIDLSYAAFWVLSAIVFAVSLMTTVVFRQYEENDLFDFVGENIPLLVLLMLVFFALMAAGALWGRARKPKAAPTGAPFSRAPFPWLMLIVGGGVSLFLVLAVRGLPTADASTLDGIIHQFAEGDYSALESGYLFTYPFQTFYVYIGEILLFLFGEADAQAWQILNVIAIEAFLYFLYQIAWEMFASRRVCLIMQILSCGAFCLFAFSTFIYLDIVSMAVQTAALYLQILYMKRDQVRYEVGAGVCIALAVLMKMNCLIALIAMVIFLIVDAIWKSNAGKAAPADEGSKKCEGSAGPEQAAGADDDAGPKAKGRTVSRLGSAILLSVMLVVFTFGASSLVELYTKWRTGIEMPEGFPTIAYLAMGLQLTEGKCGWYNGFTVSAYSQAGYDTEETTRLALEAIEESIAEFRNSGRYFVNFFYQKFISQWGDSTCVSMREMENTYRHTGGTALADWLIFGAGGTILQWVMNVFHSMVYLGNLIYAGAVLLGKRREHAAQGTGPEHAEAGDGGRPAEDTGRLRGGAKEDPHAAGSGKRGRKVHFRRFEASEAMIVIFIFGGMLFHELWEASGRYTMRYYITMLPFAAWGWSLAVDKVLDGIQKIE